MERAINGDLEFGDNTGWGSAPVEVVSSNSNEIGCGNYLGKVGDVNYMDI